MWGIEALWRNKNVRRTPLGALRCTKVNRFSFSLCVKTNVNKVIICELTLTHHYRSLAVAKRINAPVSVRAILIFNIFPSH